MKQFGVRGDIKTIAGQSFVYGAGNVLLRSLSFFLLPLYTRYLTPSDYGLMAITSMVAAILGILYPLGLHGALAKMYFDAQTEEERHDNSGTIWVSSIIIAGGMTILLDRTGGMLFPLLFQNVPFVPYFRLVIWTAFFSIFGLVPMNLLQIRERPHIYVILTSIYMLLTIGLIIWLVVIRKQGAYGYLLGQMIGSILMVPVYALFTWREARITIRLDPLRFALGYGLPLVPHNLASWLLGLSDRAILARYVSLGELGLYSLGYQIAMVMSMIAGAINMAWVPFVFKADSHDGELAHERLARLGTYYALFLCCVGLVLCLFAKDLISLFTARAFHSAAHVVPLITWGLCFGGLYYIPINFLFVKGKTLLIPIVTVLSGIVSICLNFIFIPRYGVMAAAGAAFVSNGVMLLTAWAFARRYYPLKYEYGRLVKIVIATIIVMAGASVLHFSTAWASVAAKSGLLIAFPAILVALKFFTLGERTYVVRLISSLRHRAFGCFES